MSTSVCCDTVDILGAGSCTIGDCGGGVLGSSIASSGANGPGYAYNDLSLPADAGKEICGRITTWPIDGTLYAYEDTSFSYTPAGDGARLFQYQLYVDYVAVGSPQTVALTSGGSATAAGATLTGVSTIAPGAASGTVSATAPGRTLTGTSTIAAGSATGSTVVSATAAGATLTGVSSIVAGYAQNGSTPYVSPSRTVNFGGGTNRVNFGGGTNRVNF